jgi:hypothetical protein
MPLCKQHFFGWGFDRKARDIHILLKICRLGLAVAFQVDGETERDGCE